MRNLTIYRLVLMISVLMSLSASAQDVSVKVQYPPVVTAGQQFNITWTVNSGGGEFAAPSFSPFYKLMGPQTSYNSSTQIINGRMSQSTSYTYIYFLQAVSEGKFVIPPAIFTLKSKSYSSDSLFIEVVGNGSQQKTASSNRATDQEVETGGKDIFVNLLLSRKEVYLGEPITATVKIYTRINIAGLNEIKFPQFNGFLKSDLNTPPLTSLEQENINGTIFGTGVVQQFLLYPQKTGEIIIDPVQLNVLIQQKSAQSDPFFGDFFSTYQTVPRMIASQSLKIKVNPLPGNQPDDYSGIVGKLDLKAVMSKDTVNVNDAINFRVTISGSGNLKVAAAPSMKLSPDIEVYDPKSTEDIKNGLNGTTGTKSFEYLLIPRHYGDFTIPPITYSYFNTSSGRYEQLRTQEFKFYARKGSDQNTDITVYGGVSKEDVKYLGKDIRFIKSDPGNMSVSGSLLITKRLYYSLFILAVFAFLMILFIRREHVRRNADISRVRNRKAGKVAAKRLHEASLCLKNNQLDRFYEEILKALWGYLSDKLNIPVSEMTRTRIISSLAQRGIEESEMGSLNEILDKCEYARFAPSSSGTEAASLYDGASRFIKSVENSIV
ncbi:MAG: protein BatD [Bacteroidetes bacterium]|nr:protein BatD [Bacteroidota bacterium]